jgi:Glycosyltransferase like family 2
MRVRRRQVVTRDREAALVSARQAISRLEASPSEPAPSWAREVTVAVTTYQRPCCVARLLQSIRLHYPFLRVLVSDTGGEPLFDDGTEVAPGIQWLQPPTEFGHSAAVSRNHVLRHVQTPYLFLCDDDQFFTPGTDLPRMHAFLHHESFDLVAGGQGRLGYGAAIFHERGTVLYQRFARHHGLVDVGVVACDRVENTFLARTEVVRQVQWDHRLLSIEHDEFFIRASRSGVRIAQMGSTYVGHDRRCETVSARSARLVSTVLPIHVDRHYRRQQLGVAAPRRRQAEDVRNAERRCLAELGLTEIRRERSPVAAWQLRRELDGNGAQQSPPVSVDQVDG